MFEPDKMENGLGVDNIFDTKSSSASVNTFETNNMENIYGSSKVDNIFGTEFGSTKFDQWTDNHRLERGFAFIITHSEKDKEDSVFWHRTYNCAKGQPYVPRKETYIINDRDKLYKIYENFIKKMKLELMKKNNQIEYNDPEVFARIINNLISVKTKDQKSKRIKGFNDNMNISKGKNKKQISQIRSDNNNNINSDYSLEATNVKERKGIKKCRICNSKGHNAYTCPGLAESDNSNDNDPEDDSEETSLAKSDNSNDDDPEDNSEETSIK
ncbi:8953_t:CDS:2 [Racocetra fulgida]|uniref:8953_t:CDS:1 n=1 Tax=Racocetra fulgida TaxID=60492 RepID=A0A9N9F9E3_9GLOM|nr:8953_t:CDS:2 [Racocetra fulgida]